MNKRELELYIHIPFCARKCAYCDFLSFTAPERSYREYVEKLIEEMYGQSTAYRDYAVTSIFVGGGTPSVLPPELVEALFVAVYDCFAVSADAEITIEANPGTLTMEKLETYLNCGINRLSLGLQSADGKELRTLGRIHSYDDFLKSYQRARQAGFTNINVDLMSALPGQTMQSWKNTLRKVMMLKPEHISAYSLIIEEGTPFGERYGGQSHDKGAFLPLPDEDTENRMYCLTRTFLKEQGYGRYEISNYARPGHECRHNIGYWTEVPYIGMGLGASSYFEGCRFSNVRDMDIYMGLDFSREDGAAVFETLHGEVRELTRQEQMEEFMFLGLRMIRGVSEIDFVALFGVRLESVYGPVIERLKKNGLLKQEGVWYALTEWGMDVSNFVLSEFLLS